MKSRSPGTLRCNRFLLCGKHVGIAVNADLIISLVRPKALIKIAA